MSAALGLKSKPTTTEPANDESDISALINRLTAEVNQIAVDKTKSIQQITNQMKMLALNALIESSRAGAQGAGFAVVAQEVRNVGQQVETIARELESQLTNRTGNLMSSISRMTDRSRGERMMDLSLNVRAFVAQRLIPRRDGKGRVPAVEIMLNSPLVSDLIFKGDVGGIKDLMKKSRELGMQTFDQSLFDLYEAGLITYEDALRNADSLNDLRLDIKLKGKEAKNRNMFSGIGNLDIVPEANP